MGEADADGFFVAQRAVLPRADVCPSTAPLARPSTSTWSVAADEGFRNLLAIRAAPPSLRAALCFTRRRSAGHAPRGSSSLSSEHAQRSNLVSRMNSSSDWKQASVSGEATMNVVRSAMLGNAGRILVQQVHDVWPRRFAPHPLQHFS